MSIHAVTVRVARIPLHTPYRVSGMEFHHFEPIVVEMWDDDGRYGFGEAVISEGYSPESFDDGLRYCRDVAPHLVGKGPDDARALLEAGIADYPTAASTLFSALDVLAGHPLLDVAEMTRVPLLDPVHSHEPGALADELEALLDRGFRTLKVKVGFEVEADLERVAVIQRLLDGRAEIRLDANRGFTREEGCRFAAALEPRGIQLFEQPCASEDWDSNAAVARVSTVPVMMDESIYGFEDIDRAAAMEGVGFVKLKLKKLSSVDRLREGLERIRAAGLVPVMGRRRGYRDLLLARSLRGPGDPRQRRRDERLPQAGGAPVHRAPALRRRRHRAGGRLPAPPGLGTAGTHDYFEGAIQRGLTRRWRSTDSRSRPRRAHAGNRGLWSPLIHPTPRPGNAASSRRGPCGSGLPSSRAAPSPRSGWGTP